MAPPQLAADAPILDVVHPLVVGVDPIFGDEFDGATVHGINGFLCNGFSCGVVCAHFGHGHKPLVGEHGLDDLTGALTARNHQVVGAHFHQEASRVKVLDHLFAGLKTVESLVGLRGILVDARVQVQHANAG